jgi:hypothetical protein
VFEKRVLRIIFRTKRDGILGYWRKSCNKKLHYIRTVMKSRRTRLSGYAVRMGENINAYRLLVGSPGRKRQLRRTRHAWEDNTKINLTEIGRGGMEWINLS